MADATPLNGSVDISQKKIELVRITELGAGMQYQFTLEYFPLNLGLKGFIMEDITQVSAWKPRSCTAWVGLTPTNFRTMRSGRA